MSTGKKKYILQWVNIASNRWEFRYFNDESKLLTFLNQLSGVIRDHMIHEAIPITAAELHERAHPVNGDRPPLI